MELNELIEGAKKSKKAFESLKNTAIVCGQYEFAAELKKIELEAFPETEEVKDIKFEASLLSEILRMVHLKIDPATSWVINETFKLCREKGDQFSFKDANEIMDKAKQIF